jgi:GNAT superfamily N-acetyltransferase
MDNSLNTKNMIPENFKLSCSENGYDFYTCTEKNISNKGLALEYHLWEDFHPYSSTFYDIFTDDCFQDNVMDQVWVYHNGKPVGLSLGIHAERVERVETQFMTGLIVGYIQLYVNPEHRAKGIAKKCVPMLENMHLQAKEPYKSPVFFMLQDNANPFKKYLENSFAVPRDLDYWYRNRDEVISQMEKIVHNAELLNRVLENHSVFKEEYTVYMKKQKELEEKAAMQKIDRKLMVLRSLHNEEVSNTEALNEKIGEHYYVKMA